MSVTIDFDGRYGGSEAEIQPPVPEWVTAADDDTVISSNPKDIAAREKCPLQLIPPAAERLVADVLKAGADKYGPWNWRDKGIGLVTYIGAIQRHANCIRAGEDIDSESGLPHTAHIAATAMILMDAAEHGKILDDRP